MQTRWRLERLTLCCVVFSLGACSRSAPSRGNLNDVVADEFGLAGREEIATILDALRSSDEEVRTSAAVAAGQLGSDAGPVIAALVETLRDPAPPVRAAAADSLGRIGPAAREAAPALEQLLNDQTVAEVAKRALERIGPEQQSGAERDGPTSE